MRTVARVRPLPVAAAFDVAFAVTVAVSTIIAAVVALPAPWASALAPLPSIAAAPELAAPPPDAASYAAITPCRLLDTRTAGGPATATTVAVAGRCGVPGEATAAVVTVTVPAATNAGFVTVYPAGTPAPAASNLNLVRGSTVANSAAVRLGGGALALASNVPFDKVVDVVGYFRPAVASTAGRYVALVPSRLLDTREAPSAKLAPGSTVSAPVRDVPADATAVAVNLTFTATSAAGYFTAWGDGARPLASTGNADAAGQTRAVFTLVPTAAAVHVFSQSGAHVVVDLVGYVTGASAAEGTEGLFVPRDPTRVVDTRLAPSRGPVVPGGTVETIVATASPAVALWTNLTAVQAAAPGYFTAGPASLPLPDGTSALNATAAGQTVANAAIVELSTAGVQVGSQRGGHVVVDVAGYFTGAPRPAPTTGEVIGVSAGGRPITVEHVNGHDGAARKVLVLGFMHGEEQAGAAIIAALRAATVPAGVDLWLMTTMNPDGQADGTRGNASGVDLNRNFDGGSFPWCASPGCGSGATAVNTGSAPMSEPETQAMWSFLQRERFDLVVSYHQPIETVDCATSRGATLLAACAAYAGTSDLALNRVGYLDLSGTMTNSYMQANAGRYAFTVELPAGPVAAAPHVAAVFAAASAL